MDSDSCWWGILIIVGISFLAFAFRMARTLLVSAEEELLPNEVKHILNEREHKICSLQFSFNLINYLVSILIVLMASVFYNQVGMMAFLKVIIIIFTILIFSVIYEIFVLEIPDRLATDKPSDKLVKFKFMIVVLVGISKPFYRIFDCIKRFLMGILNLPKLKPRVTVDQIISMVEIGEEQGILNTAEKDMIDGVMGFNDTVAEEIMTPRTEVFMIDLNKDPNEYMEDLLSYRYSRIPVYDDDVDNIKGILYLKDLFAEIYKKGFSEVDIKKLLRPAFFVPERKNVHTLFQEMQREHRHLSVLMDEYGGFSGIVTMEDLTEEIMGDIDDEFDADEPDIYVLTTDEAVVQGSTSIKDLNDMLSIALPEDSDDFDTISGYIIYRLGYIPKNNKVGEIEYGNVSIKVLEVEDRRIKKVKVSLIELPKL